ncbi:hypothetical protein QBC45DRAFT_428541 [Copromyces sp. CBS 386.78]|nr:hypothetical protein QBC45DRAFT_428541 [Copromyces sp. CBS 386.78]
MADRGGAPPLNNQGPSQDPQVTQRFTRNHYAAYRQHLEIDSAPGEDAAASANSGELNRSKVKVETQSEVQHLHAHTFAHRPHGRLNQSAGDDVQGRSSAVFATRGKPHPPQNQIVQHNGRKRAFEPEHGYTDVYRTTDQMEQGMGFERLPFDGKYLQNEPYTKVYFKNNGSKYKDSLELMGDHRSKVNWFAPDRRLKHQYGTQFVAKVATDDDSLAALSRTIQQEAVKQGSSIVNVWIQCQDPKEQRQVSNKLTTERFRPMQARKALGRTVNDGLVEHLKRDEAAGGNFVLAQAPASVVQAVGGVLPEPAKPTDRVPQRTPDKTSGREVDLKTEPNTEGSGIDPTIPTVSEFLSGAQSRDQVIDDDDDDDMRLTFTLIAPVKSHNAIIRRPRVPLEAVQATALRVAAKRPLKAKEPTAGAQSCDQVLGEETFLDGTPLIFTPIAPVKSHNAIIRRPRMPLEAVQATASRVAAKRPIKVKEPAANTQGTGTPVASAQDDTSMDLDSSTADVSQPTHHEVSTQHSYVDVAREGNNAESEAVGNDADSAAGSGEDDMGFDSILESVGARPRPSR